MTNTTVVFDGYIAELIRLQAEKYGLTPEGYVISFFDRRCIASSVSMCDMKCDYFFPKGALHLSRSSKNALGQFIMSVDQEPISFGDSTETVVYRVGDQTVEGVKSFASSPLVPTAEAAGGIVFTGEWYWSASGGAEYAGVFPIVNGARRHLLYDGIDLAPYLTSHPYSESWPAAYFKADRAHVFSKLDTSFGWFEDDWGITLPGLNAYLFACNANGAAEEICSLMKVYGVKLFENRKTVASLKPAVKNGTAGLYDLLSGRLLANAGLGELIYGNDD